jgi:hypothetical protein
MEIVVVRGANDPQVQIDVGVDLTGSVMELDIPWGNASVHATTQNGSLVLINDHTIGWSYTIDQSNALPAYAVARFDLWRVVGSTRSRLTSGLVRVVPLGVAPEYSQATANVPGIQGPPGVNPDQVVPAFSDVIASGVPRRIVVEADEENNAGNPSWYMWDGGSLRLFGLLEVI